MIKFKFSGSKEEIYKIKNYAKQNIIDNSPQKSRIIICDETSTSFSIIYFNEESEETKTIYIIEDDMQFKFCISVDDIIDDDFLDSLKLKIHK